MNIWTIPWHKPTNMPPSYVVSYSGDELEQKQIVSYADYEKMSWALRSAHERDRRQHELDIEILTAKLHEVEQSYYKTMQALNRDFIAALRVDIAERDARLEVQSDLIQRLLKETHTI